MVARVVKRVSNTFQVQGLISKLIKQDFRMIDTSKKKGDYYYTVSCKQADCFGII
jgi:hypothetical protein